MKVTEKFIDFINAVVEDDKDYNVSPKQLIVICSPICVWALTNFILSVPFMMYVSRTGLHVTVLNVLFVISIGLTASILGAKYLPHKVKRVYKRIAIKTIPPMVAAITIYIAFLHLA